MVIPAIFIKLKVSPNMKYANMAVITGIAFVNEFA